MQGWSLPMPPNSHAVVFLPDYTIWEMNPFQPISRLTASRSAERASSNIGVAFLVWDFSLIRALSMMMRTSPYILFRVVVYFSIVCVYVVMTGAGAGIGYGVGAFGNEDFRLGATFWGGAVGFGVTAGSIYLLREYVLYIVKASHIAVLVELIEGRDLPAGQGQIAYGRQIVSKRFVEASVLFGLDQLIKGVIAAITGLLGGVLSLLPIPGVDRIAGLLRAILKIAVGLVDEVILSHAVRTRADNPWAAAEEALVLYAQNGKVMLKNAVWLTIFIYLSAFGVFLLALAPAAALVYLFPGAWSAGGFVFALLFAWAVKAALLEPLAITCMMQVFFRVTEGQQPDPVWRARLNSVSARFVKIRDNAIGWVKGRKPEPAI